MKNKPKIGTIMYSVHEHLYHVKGKVGPVLEYCVCEAKVTEIIRIGYLEIRLVGPSPDGFRTPYSYKLIEIGKKLFYTKKEAARLAKELTEEYERKWGSIEYPDIPLRRSWEKYLTDGEKDSEE